MWCVVEVAAGRRRIVVVLMVVVYRNHAVKNDLHASFAECHLVIFKVEKNIKIQSEFTPTFIPASRTRAS